MLADSSNILTLTTRDQFALGQIPGRGLLLRTELSWYGLHNGEFELTPNFKI